MTELSIGTTPLLFIPRSRTPKKILVGKNYFFIQIYMAQAAYYGPIWQQSKGLAVISKVDINHHALNGVVYTLQHARSIERNQTVQLGISRNLIDVIPATMNRITVSFDFILDRRNQLATISKVINEGGLLSTLSFAPGASMAAQALSGLSQKLLENFIPAEDTKPLLQFSGDLNIAGDGLKEGYYAILGSHDTQNPLPTSEQLESLVVQNGSLRMNNQQVEKLSYIVLDVHCVDARTRDDSQGAAWNNLLREAEDCAQSYKINPPEGKDAINNELLKLQRILHEARTLLRADESFLQTEAQEIIASVYEKCFQALTNGMATRGTENGSLLNLADDEAVRKQLGISRDENLAEVSRIYAEKIISSRRIFKDSGIR